MIRKNTEGPSPRDEWMPNAPDLVGQEEIIRRACKLCPGNHRHAPGGVRMNGRWRSVAEYAGGYTDAFAKAMILVPKTTSITLSDEA